MRIVISTNESETRGLGGSGTYPDMLSLFNTAAFALALLPKSAAALLLPCLLLLTTWLFLLCMVRSPLRPRMCDNDGAGPVLFQKRSGSNKRDQYPSPSSNSRL
jgi:hypothetical protein